MKGVITETRHNCGIEYEFGPPGRFFWIFGLYLVTLTALQRTPILGTAWPVYDAGPAMRAYWCTRYRRMVPFHKAYHWCTEFLLDLYYLPWIALYDHGFIDVPEVAMVHWWNPFRYLWMTFDLLPATRKKRMRRR